MAESPSGVLIWNDIPQWSNHRHFTLHYSFFSLWVLVDCITFHLKWFMRREIHASAAVVEWNKQGGINQRKWSILAAWAFALHQKHGRSQLHFLHPHFYLTTEGFQPCTTVQNVHSHSFVTVRKTRQEVNSGSLRQLCQSVPTAQEAYSPDTKKRFTANCGASDPLNVEDNIATMMRLAFNDHNA